MYALELFQTIHRYIVEIVLVVLAIHGVYTFLSWLWRKPPHGPS